MNVAEAYAECRATAQREAKNFYYAFRALPQHKSDAMCAVYAFMRKADDLADDESVPLEERRRRMSEWTENWRRARGGETDDPVFLALNDTQKRFGISDELLEKLVEGTTLDLNPQPPGTQITVCYTSATTVENVQAYLDQEALYDYCYLVASVVGLVCIRIFGYSDPAAEKLAEDTGIAFQLTNILRDVNEDLARNRCYLPLMIKMFAEDALAFYRSAEKLIPLIDADSRAALWVLVRIYFELLNTIYKADGDVFTVRRSVSDKRKAWILVQGMLRARWYQWRG